MNETITITGNVASDPQHRHAGGVSITTFRVASGQRRFDKRVGAWVDGETNWYTVSTFRSLADHALQSLHKGDRVLLTGRLKVRDWEAGEKRGTTVEIDAEAIGHDLLWGTSRFEKDRRPGPPSAESAEAWSTSPTPAGEWSTPGVTDQVTPEWPVAELGPAASAPPDEDSTLPLELAGVETPF